MVDEIVNNLTAERSSPEDRLREAIVTGPFQPSERLIEGRCGPRAGGGALRHAARHAQPTDIEDLERILDGMRRRLDGGDGGQAQ
jgi:DNA-binding GntR family transcriptional regulator